MTRMEFSRFSSSGRFIKYSKIEKHLSKLVVSKSWASGRTRKWCNSSVGGWVCSREPGHKGPHIACNSDFLCATWPQTEEEKEAAPARRKKYLRAESDKFLDGILK